MFVQHEALNTLTPPYAAFKVWGALVLTGSALFAQIASIGVQRGVQSSLGYYVDRSCDTWIYCARFAPFGT